MVVPINAVILSGDNLGEDIDKRTVGETNGRAGAQELVAALDLNLDTSPDLDQKYRSKSRFRPEIWTQI